MTKPSLLAGATALALALAATAATAAPILLFDTPGLTSTTLASGVYAIRATGGSGGRGIIFNTDAVGRGAVVEGTFTFGAAQLLTILVGGVGGDGRSGAGGGGGGGSFVVGPDNTPFLIAGGGGGGSFLPGGAGGAPALVGGAGGRLVDGSGGGGLTGDGGGNGRQTSFVSGGQGGFGSGPNAGAGGIGGGGGGGEVGGGGGGGYTGGDGGSFGIGSTGGSSFNAGANPSFSLATAFGNGSVSITHVTPVPPAAGVVSEPLSAALLGVGLLGFGLARRRDAALSRNARSPACASA